MTYRAGDRCVNASKSRVRSDHVCVGRLVVERFRDLGEGKLRPDPDGDVRVLVCSRCGQAHGRLSEFFCRTCVLHDRSTIVESVGVPTEACPFEGEGERSCKRTEWRRKTWGCVRCATFGRTTIVESDEQPTVCPEFPGTHHMFVLTEEAAFAFDAKRRAS